MEIDNTKHVSLILDKKLDGYNTDMNNFTAPGEVTVTITLKEYRTLVSNDATRSQAIDAANKDKYAREQQIKELTAANDKLKGENYDLKTMIDALKEQIAGLTGKDAADA